MTNKQWHARMNVIKKSRTGCDCVGRSKCSKNWIRCNGTIKVRNERLAKLGPEPGR